MLIVFVYIVFIFLSCSLVVMQAILIRDGRTACPPMCLLCVSHPRFASYTATKTDFPISDIVSFRRAGVVPSVHPPGEFLPLERTLPGMDTFSAREMRAIPTKDTDLKEHVEVDGWPSIVHAGSRDRFHTYLLPTVQSHTW